MCGYLPGHGKIHPTIPSFPLRCDACSVDSCVVQAPMVAGWTSCFMRNVGLYTEKDGLGEREAENLADRLTRHARHIHPARCWCYAVQVDSRSSEGRHVRGKWDEQFQGSTYQASTSPAPSKKFDHFLLSLHRGPL